VKTKKAKTIPDAKSLHLRFVKLKGFTTTMLMDCTYNCTVLNTTKNSFRHKGLKLDKPLQNMYDKWPQIADYNLFIAATQYCSTCKPCRDIVRIYILSPVLTFVEDSLQRQQGSYLLPTL